MALMVKLIVFYHICSSRRSLRKFSLREKFGQTTLLTSRAIHEAVRWAGFPTVAQLPSQH